MHMIYIIHIIKDHKIGKRALSAKGQSIHAVDCILDYFAGKDISISIQKCKIVFAGEIN